jgi:hypothetical protein
MLVAAVLNVAFLTTIFYWLWKREQDPLKKYFVFGLLFKLMAGISLGLLYTYYYDVGDTFLYFQDGQKLAQLARTDIGSYIAFLWSGDESYSIWTDLIYKQPRAAFLAKITSLFSLITYDNYWIISLYFSAISFVTAWFLVKSIIAFYPAAQTSAIIGFLFFPSVVFWSSGVIKESLAMAGLFYISYFFLKVWKKRDRSLMEWLVAALSVWVVWNLKYYYLAIYLPVAATALVVRFLIVRIKVNSVLLKVGLWLIVFIVPLVVVSRVHPNFYPERFMGVVVTSYYEFQAISSPEDVIHYDSLEPTLMSIVRNIPWALLSGLFRPTIIEAQNVLQFFISIENTILIIFVVSTLLNIKSIVQSRNRLLLFSMLMYSLLLCVFLALSTPNFGTLSRYRVGFLPVLVFLVTIKNPLINTIVNQIGKGTLFRR